MPKQIFDQDRPRSTMAQQLDEAFAGCDQWTLAPPAPRRSGTDFEPRASSSTQGIYRTATLRAEEPGTL